MTIQRDGNDQPYIEWDQGQNCYKRAWIQKRDETDKEKNYAGTPQGRYLNVVRCDRPGRPLGNPADFPIFNELPDEQILLAFVYATNAITGVKL